MLKWQLGYKSRYSLKEQVYSVVTISHGSKTVKVLRPGLAVVRIKRNCVTIFVSYPLVMTSRTLVGQNTY